MKTRLCYWLGITTYGLMLLLLLIGLVTVQSCSEEKQPMGTAAHPSGWADPGSADFHGQALLSGSLSMLSCQSCHGEDFRGGSTRISCYASGCHVVYPHPEGFATEGAPEFHGDFIQQVLGWDLAGCQSCHGQDYGGKGVAEKNCLTCHRQPGGPEACNTCHGSAQNAAPPVDLADNQSVRVRGVGAHQKHMTGTRWSTFTTARCRSCHQVPASYEQHGHIDQTPGAEVRFDPLANGRGTSPALWNRATGSCANVYCHGAFQFRREESNYPWAYSDSLMVGNNATVYWQFPDADQALCGSCHGLPPTGHIAVSDCATCHGRVVNARLEIVNKFLHINGQVDVF